MAIQMRQVERAETDPLRGSIRRHIAQASNDLRHRAIDGKGDADTRAAKDLHLIFQRRGVETGRQRIILRLIAGEFIVEPHARTEIAPRLTDGCRV